MGNRNNGLLDQQIQTLLNTGGQDRLQQAQLDFGIPTYNARTMPTSVFRPTFTQRQSARDEIIARALANQDQRAIDPETARQNYLDQFNLGVQSLRGDVSRFPGFSDTANRIREEQRALDEEGKKQILDPILVTDDELDPEAPFRGREMEIDPGVTTPSVDTTQRDMTVVSPEDFIMQRVSPGSQAFPAGTTRPADTTDEDDADADRDPPRNILDLFDNKQALGKIALGVALLEGMPIDDAFALYDSFAPSTDLGERIEVYDKTTGQTYFFGEDDPILSQYEGNPNFSIQPFGTQANINAQLRKENLARQTQDLKAYNESNRETKKLLDDAKRLKRLLDSGEVTTGPGQGLIVTAKRWGQLFGIEADISDEAVFETIISRLIPQIRPTGAGSTSDFEINLYERALPSMRRTVEENQAIINELLLANEITDARNEYVITNVSNDPDGQAITYENAFSDLVNIVMDRYGDPGQGNEFGFTMSRQDISKEEQELLGDLFTFVEEDDLEEYLANQDDDKDVRLVIIGE